MMENGDVSTDVLVSVRRHPQDWQTATYRLNDVHNLHWDCVSGGVGRVTSHPALFGYVWCNGAVSGGVAHSCRHGPPPHRIKICLPKVCNKEHWPTIMTQVPSRQQKSSATAPAGRLPEHTRRGASVIAAMEPVLARALAKPKFDGRGLSDRTVEALVSGSIDAPERLLFMTPASILKIKGIGKAALAEIENYRNIYLPVTGEADASD